MNPRPLVRLLATTTLLLTSVLFARADSLARSGRAQAVIVTGPQATPFDQWTASELQRYLQTLSGAEFSIVPHDKLPKAGLLLVLGGPQNNPLTASAQQQHLVRFDGLKPEGFLLKTITLDNRPALVVGGNDESGTMYAVYELLERLGVVFQLTGDILPQRKPDLPLPTLDLRIEPAQKIRGMHCCHGLRWYMGMGDFQRHIDQLAKLKLNCLQFYAGLGSPWIECSYQGTKADIIYSKESGYLAWQFALSTSGTARDVRIGRQSFPHDYLGPPEFARVTSPQEAWNTARDFLRQVIRYAHQRKVQVWILQGEIPYVTPNLLRPGEKSLHEMYCGVGLPPGDPRVAGLWHSALTSAIETYPEADAFGVWTSELFLDMNNPQTQELLKSRQDVRKLIPSLEEIHRGGYLQPSQPGHLDSDLAQICVASQVIQSVKKDHPKANLGLAVLFRSYLFPALDSLLPKDVWLMSMETWANSGPIMHYYGDVRDRQLIVMPRVDDDGSELHMQLNATMYDRDKILSGSHKYGVTGMVGQLNKERGLESNARYLADGAWRPDLDCRSFYDDYLGRIYGPKARDSIVQAYLLLEENDKALDWHGRHGIFIGYARFSPCNLKGTIDFKPGDVAADRKRFEKDLQSALQMQQFWTARKAQCQRALALLQTASPDILPGSREELQYVTFKTENLASYFDVLDAIQATRGTLDLAWLARCDGRTESSQKLLLEASAQLDHAFQLAQETARQMIPFSNIPTERYLLFRYNQNVLGSIDECRSQLARRLASDQVR